MSAAADDHVIEALTRLGGVAGRAELIALTSRRDVDRALAGSTIVSVRRGYYGLPVLGDALAIAKAAGGVLCLTSAALHHGWAAKSVPELPHVLLARGRRVPPVVAGRGSWHRGDLLPEELDGGATSREVTLLQCLRQLPFDEALAIADSARRDGESALLTRVARQARGPGSPQVRRVVEVSTPDAANPFESVLRAICASIPGLTVRPQVLITSVIPWVRPDLVDEDLRLVIEADSFEWHGNRAALRNDARRYNLLVADGWLVLRFAWEDVMFEPDYVRSVVAALVRRVLGSTEVRGRVESAA
ncbi:DUF559 domain-containing protein [Nocardioides sp.]|uniref:DUF559 domain-containing protein n=1 Tax=Nocardioides sp. TaxID=35761 RepID=UPI0039E2A03A